MMITQGTAAAAAPAPPADSRVAAVPRHWQRAQCLCRAARECARASRRDDAAGAGAGGGGVSRCPPRRRDSRTDALKALYTHRDARANLSFWAKKFYSFVGYQDLSSLTHDIF